MSLTTTNIASSIAQNVLQTNSKSMDKAYERLATGKRINSAEDDIAGLGVAAKLDANSRSIKQGVRNANSAIAMLQTYQEAGQNILRIVIRMKRLAVDAATDTKGINDKLALDSEFNQLGMEWTRIATNTQWNSLNGMAAFNAGFTVRLDGGPATGSGAFTMTLRNWDPTLATAAQNVTGATTASSNDQNANPLQAYNFTRNQNNLAATPIANMRSNDHIQSRAAATAAAVKLDNAITNISAELATQGSYINRLEYTAEDLMTRAISMDSSLSRIRDTDYAAESTALSRAQIIEQAAAAILVQANQSPQVLLALLK